MERAPLEEPYEETFALRYRHLYEAGIRLLAALGTEAAFPDDVAGIERLLERVTYEEHSVMRFAIEDPDGLPRFTGRHQVWLSPTGDGSLRLRYEDGAFEAAVATLAPDGRLSGFGRERGFGVPDSELTPTALADRAKVERRIEEDEITAAESEVRIDEQQRRFRAERLRGVTAAPWQDPTGPVVSWVAFYDTGFVVSCVSPPAEDEWPAIEVTDDRGTAYEAVGIGGIERDRALHNDRIQFGPAVPPEAQCLILRGEWGVVDVKVKR